MKRVVSGLVVLMIVFLTITNVFADDRVINFVVAYKTVNFAGKQIKAIAINNQIPGPALHFKEGDHVTINVFNHLDQETAIHWHGIILPWQMDGVLGVTQQGIQPGGVFHYQFTPHQAGTYWYHSHAGLQEQQGLYGALIIDSPQPPHYKYSKDYVIVLSDWSNTNPDQILSNLKKSGDYYSPRFPLQPSLIKFIHDYRKASIEERKRLIDDYKMMQQMRMSIYDLSDVAYDAFLLNGHSNANPWVGAVQVGDVVRLRFIGAGASTIFHVKIPDANMQMVHVEGNDVKPYTITDFTIAPGETYDVLVKIQKNKPYIIYAESKDRVGAAYGALVNSSQHFVDYQNTTPFPEPLPVTREMMEMMMGKVIHEPAPMSMPMHKSDIKAKSPKTHEMSMSQGMPMNSTMTMPTESTLVGDAISSQPSDSYDTSSGTKYQNVRAAVKTNDPNKPISKVIKMELFGYMDHYIWFINGLPEDRAKPIILEPGKRYRVIFTNSSMMHHPMHIHGHWFILREGNGPYDPLLHTMDVPPGATMTADLDADESGQWLFHCHLLYHMMSGMARIFQYSTLIEITKHEAKLEDTIESTAYINRPIVRVDKDPIDMSLVMHHMAHPMNLYFSNYLEVGADPFYQDQKMSFKGLYGRDYDKIELFMNDAEMRKGAVENADLDIFYWHLLDQFWAIKGGVNYFYRPAQTPYWQPGVGIEGLMPYFIDTSVRGYFYSGSAKLDIELSRDTQITNNFFIRAGVRGIFASKTVTKAAIGTGLNQARYIIRPYYRLLPGMNVFVEYEYEKNYGVFRNIETMNGDSASQDTVTLGFAVLF